MRIRRCPRCRAEDIGADAHPTRLLQNGVVAPVFVCRSCFRPAELEFRIACETNGIPYAPLSIREALQRLAHFYAERLRELDEPALYADDLERGAATLPVRVALADVERRLAVVALD